MAKKQKKKEQGIELSDLKSPIGALGYVVTQQAIIMALRAEIKAWELENEELRRQVQHFSDLLDDKRINKYQKLDLLEAFNKTKDKQSSTPTYK